jgi:basic membrane protein A
VPAVDRYIAGYQAGAKKADPGVKTLNGYSNSFTALAKCKNLANTQISGGADVIFQVAGGCGLGALDAAKTKGVWGIGVDADQSRLGPHILASAIKKVDAAVFLAAQAVKNGKFAGGKDTIFTLKQNAVGIAGINKKVPASVKAKVLVIANQIKAGKIKIPDKV